MSKPRYILTLALVWVFGAAQAEAPKGPETGLPLPRYVSIKSAEANVRRGPSLSHRIDWVYKRRDLPVQVVAEHGHWRRVVDIEGAGGWIHYALLSGVRTVIITEDKLPAYAQKDTASEPRAYFEKGVVARLGDCDLTWCHIRKDGHRGWVDKAALWGVEFDEVRE